AVADSAYFGDAMADGRAKHDKIQRCRDDRRNNALHQSAPRSGHFEKINGAHGVNIQFELRTSFTKISSSELCLVCRSLKARPARLRSLKSAAMSLCACCMS